MNRKWSFGAVGVVIGLMCMTGSSTVAADSDASADTSFVHPSGLNLSNENSETPIPEDLRDAYAALDLLAEFNPDDFGYVSVGRDNRSLVIGIASEAGPSKLRRFKERVSVEVALGSAGPEQSGKRQSELAKVAGTIGKVTVQLRNTRSRAETEEDKDSVIDLAGDPAFASAGIWQSRVDRDTGRVVLSVGDLTPELASRLVRDYGQNRVAVNIAENPE